jgi:acyl transferase domain-containing protein
MVSINRTIITVPFKEAGLKVPVESLAWPEAKQPRVSVNCFGNGGANAHDTI